MISLVFKIQRCRTVEGRAGATSVGAIASAVPRNACLSPLDRELRFASYGITSLTHGQIMGRGECARYLEGDKPESQYQNGHGRRRKGGRRNCGVNAGSGPHSFLILAKALLAPGLKACLWPKEAPALLLSRGESWWPSGPLPGRCRAHHTGLHTRHGSKDGALDRGRGCITATAGITSAIPVLVQHAHEKPAVWLVCTGDGG